MTFVSCDECNSTVFPNHASRGRFFNLRVTFLPTKVPDNSFIRLSSYLGLLLLVDLRSVTSVHLLTLIGWLTSRYAFSCISADS